MFISRIRSAYYEFSGAQNAACEGTKRRQISKQSLKNRSPKGRAPVNRGRGGLANTNKAATTVTKQLVQKLVKKALAQTNIGRNRTVGLPRSAQRGNIRGGRIVKKTVVLNRMKMNPRSKVIARRHIVPQKVVTVRRQRPIQYRETYTVQQPIVRRVNYVPNNTRRPIIVRQQPRTVIVQQRQPNYRRGNYVGNGGRTSIREHINQMRQGHVMTTRVQRRQPQQQQVRVIRQKQFVPTRPQRNRQQRNNNFGNRGQRKAEYNPMFEPANFLQRIPSQNSGGRRFVQY
ncbi:hypothetical protein DdX_07388 [Ditylenchus destructor]|uniref:Uncharacterized protein n=1 Tax=Ditylenchus destructor TaxID=166010 RepID=A0AAD4R1T1_9BILA|nr:hypothetical protein DdX_07388 [Ditylenchus destructor]